MKAGSAANVLACNGSLPWQGGTWLRQRRTALGMTQRDLAEKTGISLKLISAYENDYRTPRKENRRLLLEALGGMPAEEPRTAPAADDEQRPPARPKVTVDEEAFCREARRLLGPRDVAVHFVWRDENGDLAAIAETLDDNCLNTIRTRVTPTTLDDIRSLLRDVARLEARLQRSEP